MTTDHSLDAVGPDPDAAARPWRLGNLPEARAETAGDTTALVIGTQRRPITYADLADLIVAQCAALQHSGLRPGDVVALQSTNSIAFVVGLFAAARADLVVAPIDPALPPAERQTRVDMVGARVTLTDAHQQPRGASPPDYPGWLLQTADDSSAQEKPALRLVVSDPPRAITSPIPGLTDQDALIMFTSGTTGKPKMVPWTHNNIAAALAGIADGYQLGPSDATVAVMPLFHGHGLIAALLATLATGGRVVLPARGRFSAHTFWDDVAAVDATWYTAVPTVHQILLDRAPTDLPGGQRGRLRFIRSCSAPLSAATVQRMESTFNTRVLAAYGMTETTHQASSVRPGADQLTRLHTVGTPTGLSVRIVDGDGKTCPIGDTGEIWLSGPTVVRGYLNNTAATEETFADGWVRTGDLGTVDNHGTLTLTGRIKEQINRGGEKISPEHVEDVLTSYPSVAQAAVFGIRDPLYGERIAAVVVARNGVHLDPEDLIAYSRDRLAPFEIPDRITLVDKLPLTAKGAIDRSKLAEDAGQTP